jgi:hypothetical protein
LEKRVTLRFTQQVTHKRQQSAQNLMRLLETSLERAKYQVWQALHHAASQGLRRQRDIRDRFELIEQEKDVLEEEFGNALTLNEDLQVQYESLLKVLCPRCFDTASPSKLVHISSQLERHLYALSNQHRHQVILEEEDLMSQEEDEQEKQPREGMRDKVTQVSSGETSTTAGGYGKG